MSNGRPCENLGTAYMFEICLNLCEFVIRTTVCAILLNCSPNDKRLIFVLTVIFATDQKGLPDNFQVSQLSVSVIKNSILLHKHR
jgi:hypothetical protein